MEAAYVTGIIYLPYMSKICSLAKTEVRGAAKNFFVLFLNVQKIQTLKFSTRGARSTRNLSAQIYEATHPWKEASACYLELLN